MAAADGDDSAATSKGTKGREQAGAMHLRAHRHTSVEGCGSHDIGDMFCHVRGCRDLLVEHSAGTTGSPDVLLGPHHTFGHACGAARVNEQHVITLARHIQGTAIAGCCQSLIRLELAVGCIVAEVRTRVAVVHLNPQQNIGQALPQGFYLRCKLGGKNHHPRIRIIDDVPEFIFHIAEVDIHMG